MKIISFFFVLSTALLACSSDSSDGGASNPSGSGGSTGGSGGTSGGASNCLARCQALSGQCGDPSACGQVCASITEKQLGCLESSKCNQAAYDACTGGGAAGSGGSTAGGGGSPAAGSGGSVAAGSGGSSSGECPNSGIIPGVCEDKSGSSLDSICANLSTQKRPLRCCNVPVKEGCYNTGTTDNNISLQCCP
jgi:hypothetical protein